MQGMFTGGPGGADPNTLAPIQLSYSSLSSLADASGLTLGRKYQIAYQGRGQQPGTGGAVTFTGAEETLILTAATSSTLEKIAESVTYPDDIVHYSLSNAFYADGLSQTGTVTYRKYVPRAVEADFDFRALISRCWERTPGSGVYSGFSDPGGGAAYQDFSVFPAGCLVPPGTTATYDFGAVKLNIHRNGDNGTWEWPFNVFQGGAYRVKAGYGADKLLCVGIVEKAHFGCCSSVVCEGTIRGYWSSDGVSIEYSTGNLTDVIVNQRVSSVNGDLVSCKIDPTFLEYGYINGDHTGVSFGASNDGPGVLGPELIAVPTFNQPDSAAAWSGETITGGVLVFNNGEEEDTETTPIVAVAGADYMVEVLVSAYTSGELWCQVGNPASPLVISGVGLWRQVMTATDTYGFVAANQTMIGAVSRVSVRRVW